jgi:hypothetical protein
MKLKLNKFEPVLLSQLCRTNISGEAKEDGVHHGRLAIEQTYGYLVHDKILYGIISTFNAFVFLKRGNPGILHMSQMIPNNFTPLTIT